MGDTPPNPPEADEAFIAGLDALDRGLAAPSRMAPQPVDVPEPSALSIPPLDRAGASQDPLDVPEILDLYPPPRPSSPSQGAGAADQPATANRPARTAFPPSPASTARSTGAGVPVSFGSDATARATEGSSSSRDPDAPLDAGFTDAAGRPRFDDDVLGDLPKESAPLALREYVVLGIGALVLVTMGAAGGAYVFRERVAQVMAAWVAVPAPPSAPGVAVPSPIQALPIPPDDPDAR